MDWLEANGKDEANFIETEDQLKTTEIKESKESVLKKEPRDNGFAECRGRTLIKDTRTLLASANMHYSYWPYAMEYACQE